MKDRRPDYDITDEVFLNYADSVREAVSAIFRSTFKQFNQGALTQAFEDCERLFEGDYPTYLPCDTLYHDKQHTMDMTLALARLISGHEQSVSKAKRLGAERAVTAIITALYHDSGYIRHQQDHHHFNGAEYTPIHVSRSADFLKRYLYKINLGKYSIIAANMVHYTGYEIKPENISLPDKKWHLIGHMLGTADLIAQMSDYCYLEKCRDRLYPEFVLGGLSVTTNQQGEEITLYQSGEDLLRKTPLFYNKEAHPRLNILFNKVYQYEATHFDNNGHYIKGLESNQTRLQQTIESNSLEKLNRKPAENYGTKNFPGLTSYLNQHPLKKEKTANRLT